MPSLSSVVRACSYLCALAVPVAAVVACATSTSSGSPFSGSNNNSLGNSTGGSGSSTQIGGGMLGGGVGGSNSSSGGSARAQRCNDAGCTCFNIASLGYGGATGAQAGNGGSDNTAAFINYLNTESSASAAMLGCGTDMGCSSPSKPTIDANFLSQYDVLIMQWLTNGLTAVTISGASYGYTGSTAGYWSFSQSELDALKTWVNGGGGLIFLSGYDFCPQPAGSAYASMCSGSGEIGPQNQVLQYFTHMSYIADDTYGATIAANGAGACLQSNPVTGWSQTSLLGDHINAVGAFHGRGITAASPAVTDCSGTDSAGNMVAVAAHEDIGSGHVYVYNDEWVTYTSQWNPPCPNSSNPQCSSYCVTDAGSNPATCACSGCYQYCPSVQAAYQSPQFWYDAIEYASQATMCPFMLQGAIPR